MVCVQTYDCATLPPMSVSTFRSLLVVALLVLSACGDDEAPFLDELARWDQDNGLCSKYIAIDVAGHKLINSDCESEGITTRGPSLSSEQLDRLRNALEALPLETTPSTASCKESIRHAFIFKDAGTARSAAACGTSRTYDDTAGLAAEFVEAAHAFLTD